MKEACGHNNTGEATCGHCGVTFTHSGWAKRQYCSRQCWGRSRSMKVTSNCPQCGTDFEQGPGYKKVHCSRECSSRSRWPDQDAAKSGFDAETYRAVLRCQNSAKSRGLIWRLSTEHASRLINDSCYLCGEPGPGGIDRFDSNYGYIPINVWPCCTDCNLLKGAHHYIDFVEKVRSIYKHLSKSGNYTTMDRIIKEYEEQKKQRTTTSPDLNP